MFLFPLFFGFLCGDNFVKLVLEFAKRPHKKGFKRNPSETQKNTINPTKNQLVLLGENDCANFSISILASDPFLARYKTQLVFR